MREQSMRVLEVGLTPCSAPAKAAECPRRCHDGLPATLVLPLGQLGNGQAGDNWRRGWKRLSQLRALGA